MNAGLRIQCWAPSQLSFRSSCHSQAFQWRHRVPVVTQARSLASHFRLAPVWTRSQPANRWARCHRDGLTCQWSQCELPRTRMVSLGCWPGRDTAPGTGMCIHILSPDLYTCHWPRPGQSESPTVRFSVKMPVSDSEAYLETLKLIPRAQTLSPMINRDCNRDRYANSWEIVKSLAPGLAHRDQRG